MPTNMPVMPFLVLILLLLPIKLSSLKMKSLALILWLTGGFILLGRGVTFLLQNPEPPSSMLLIFSIVLAVVIGLAKGKFVLSKTSQKNIERIDAFTEPKAPIHVYSVRSWIIISLMVLISLSLTFFNAPALVRGAVNIGIGAALIVSSLAYMKAICNAKQPDLSTP